MILICNRELVTENGLCQIIASVRDQSKGIEKTVWYTVSEKYRHFLSDNYDAFVVGLLIPAMESGSDMIIDGGVSDNLLTKLSGPTQEVLLEVMPNLKKINIKARINTRTTAKGDGIATGFSAGVDSYCTVADHADIPDGSHSITHLLFNNVGSHGAGGESLFYERYERLRKLAESIGLPLISVNSNLDEFYTKEYNFQQTHTLRNASVAHILSKGIKSFMYASAFHYHDVFVKKTRSIAHADPVLLPLVSSCHLEAYSTGSIYSRVGKIMRVSNYPMSYDSLDVCVNANNTSSYINCSECWKCLRTIATLEVAGKLHLYERVFDLDKYRKIKHAFYRELLSSDDPLMKEVVDFARDNNFAFPKHMEIYYRAIRIISETSPYKIIKKTKSMIYKLLLK